MFQTMLVYALHRQNVVLQIYVATVDADDKFANANALWLKYLSICSFHTSGALDNILAKGSL